MARQATAWRHGGRGRGRGYNGRGRGNGQNTSYKRKEKEMRFATQAQMTRGYYGTYTSVKEAIVIDIQKKYEYGCCLLYTSPSPRDATLSRMPSSA